jgi:UDP-N-acetylglucosamine diphosphorylase/glucosamine-1-phosphate N-acetyltransferase
MLLFLFLRSLIMNKIIFTEEFCQPENLLPFTLTRQIQDIRVGILTIREKWEKMLGLPSFDKKEDDYKDLSRSIDLNDAVADGTCFMIHGNMLPTGRLIKAVRKLKDGEFLTDQAGNGIVYRFTKKQMSGKHKIKVGKAIIMDEPVVSVRFPWDIIAINDKAIRLDFELITKKRRSAAIPANTKVTGRENIFIEKGASVSHAVINATTGPVYIGKNATVMEGCLIRGPFAMCEDSCLKLGTKVYGATTLGPNCTGGGEIKNTVMFGYSNKAHDGYLGDSVVGEWCNLGAGTTNSNLKNNAGEVRIWTPAGQKPAGNKCGAMIGDYSRTAIQTAINTGTVIGVCCNVFGTGLTPKHIPNFTWGHDDLIRYDAEKALADIANWKKLKGKVLSPDETSILKYIFENF